MLCTTALIYQEMVRNITGPKKKDIYIYIYMVPLPIHTQSVVFTENYNVLVIFCAHFLNDLFKTLFHMIVWNASSRVVPYIYIW